MAAGSNVVELRKRTGKARETVLDLLDKYAPKVSTWLDQIAEGVKNENGGVMTRPDPVKATELYLTLLEFGVPKLQRTELTGKDGKDLVLVQASKYDEAL